MRRPILVILFALAALPFHAGEAQIIRGGTFRLKEPQLWVSAGAGWQQGWSVVDGATGIRWRFSDAMSYGAAVERTITGGTTVGIRASTGRVAVDYQPLRISGSALQADAMVSQAFAGVRVSSGRGLHSVLELGAGATFYSGFEERGTGRRLPPDKVDADFAFVFGYGLGYTFSRSFQVDVVQDLATSLHQKAGLAAGESSSARMSGTRLVARYGLGG